MEYGFHHNFTIQQSYSNIFYLKFKKKTIQVVRRYEIHKSDKEID